MWNSFSTGVQASRTATYTILRLVRPTARVGHRADIKEEDLKRQFPSLLQEELAIAAEMLDR